MSQIKLPFTKKKRLLCQGYDGETTPGLVKLKIYTQCKCLKAPEPKIKIKIDAKGSKTLHKDKSLRVCYPSTTYVFYQLQRRL
jgi:hypothetical protein